MEGHIQMVPHPDVSLRFARTIRLVYPVQLLLPQMTLGRSTRFVLCALPP